MTAPAGLFLIHCLVHVKCHACTGWSFSNTLCYVGYDHATIPCLCYMWVLWRVSVRRLPSLEALWRPKFGGRLDAKPSLTLSGGYSAFTLCVDRGLQLFSCTWDWLFRRCPSGIKSKCRITGKARDRTGRRLFCHYYLVHGSHTNELEMVSFQSNASFRTNSFMNVPFFDGLSPLFNHHPVPGT